MKTKGRRKSKYLVNVRGRFEELKEAGLLRDVQIVDTEEELKKFVSSVKEAQETEIRAAKREKRLGRDIEIHQTLGWKYKE